jgi:hypothetical protein
MSEGKCHGPFLKLLLTGRKGGWEEGRKEGKKERSKKNEDRKEKGKKERRKGREGILNYIKQKYFIS